MVCQKYKINPKDVNVRVSDKAEEMPGTSAELQAGDILTLHELLYALMLPSGNDASIAIADTVGKIIQRNKRNPTKKTYF
jgi:D-alanyl-D-alanine carboxypeptidase (penicillin-binding protein 5/6)